MLPDFNSIKVRLEQSAKKEVCASRLFQFHKGAIRTLALPVLLAAVPDFNSIKVRLEQPEKVVRISFSPISIP